MTEERRNDSEIKLIQNDLTHLTRRFEESEIRAETWRNSFCIKQDGFGLKQDLYAAKITELLVKLAELPCKTHSDKFKNIDNQVKGLWATVGIVFVAVMTAFIKGL